MAKAKPSCPLARYSLMLSLSKHEGARYPRHPALISAALPPAAVVFTV